MFKNLDLMMLLGVVVIDASVAFWTYRDNPKSATNKLYALLSFSIICWLISAYLFGLPVFAVQSIIWARLGIFFAAPMSALFFLLAHTLPSETILLSKRAFYTTIASVIAMMTFNISPFAFVGFEVSGGSTNLKAGWGIIPFAVISTLFSFLTVYYLIKKFRYASGEERKRIKFVLWGVLIMLALIIFTILIPILLYNNAFFVAFTPLYTVIFLGFTAYAIFRHHLFNIKVLASEIFTALIVTTSLLNVLNAADRASLFIGGLAMITVTAFGVLLVRSVYQEVRSKEKIENLAQSLEAANTELKRLDRAKSEFISIASHQLRTPLTIIKGYLSMIREGNYGTITSEVSMTVNKMYLSNERLIKLVNDLLDLSRMESGRMKYEFLEMDLEDVIDSAVDEFQLPAKDKHIKIIWKKDSMGLPKIWGDAWKLRQVIFNLIDNALKYNREGDIEIKLEKEDDSLKLSIKDSGIGMTEETINNIFHKFSRGRESAVAKVNAVGVGLGLYIAKRIVDDHGGNIWVESAGEGKGSVFYVRLPLVSKHNINPQLTEFTTNE
ncbi:MAG: ATP-binding protein [bacterium]|nr:ATP-binding protein [bacterium]